MKSQQEIQQKKQLRQLAEELAYTEDSIMLWAAYSKNNPSSDAAKGIINHGKSRPTDGTKKWIIISVVLLILFWPLAFLGVYKAYTENKRYKKAAAEWDKECRTQEELVKFVTDLETKRETLIEQLDAICESEPSLDKNYWWKEQLLPAVDFNLLPGREPVASDWNFILLNHPWITEGETAFYLQDMTEFKVTIPGDEGRQLAASDDYAVIYKNDDLLRDNKNGFAYAHLYACSFEGIEEVVKSTVRTAIDKEAERSAYKNKLDQQEILINALAGKSLMTDEEQYLTGKTSLQDYVHESLIRGMYEADFEQKLSARGDYDERSTYSKGFHGLYRVSLYNCADVLIGCDDMSATYCAAILVPREKQAITQLCVRAADKENPFGGRLERYGDIPAYQELNDDKPEGPSIRMAVDHLLDWGDAEILHLKNRDVLMECPAGMDKYEFAYLIRKDNPLSRKSNAEAAANKE